MYKILSRSRLPLSMMVVDEVSNVEVLKTVPGFGVAYSTKLTETIQQLSKDNMVSVLTVEDSTNYSSVDSDPVRESETISETLTIDKLTPEVIDGSEGEVTEDVEVEAEEAESSDPMTELESMSLTELKALADDNGVTYRSNISKDTLINKLAEANVEV